MPGEPAGRLAGVEEPDGDHKRSVKEKGTEAVAKARARAEDLLAEAEANRPRSRLIDIAFGSFERDAEVGGGILAGAVAFRVFLFIVPFVFFFVVAFGLVADAVGATVSSATHTAGIAGLLATTINNVGDQSVWSRLTILAVSGVALVLGARNLVKVLTVIHVLIWHLPRVRLRRQARAVGLLILAVIGALALAQLTSKLQDRSFAAWVFATSAFMLIPAGLWLLASLKLFPHPPEVGWQDLVPGALLVGVGIEALHVFTVVYVADSFERKSETYGAIGGSLSILLWAYVVGRILAASPVINAVVWRRATRACCRRRSRRTCRHPSCRTSRHRRWRTCRHRLWRTRRSRRTRPRSRRTCHRLWRTRRSRRTAARTDPPRRPSPIGLEPAVLPPPTAPGGPLNGVLPPPAGAGQAVPDPPVVPVHSALPPPVRVDPAVLPPPTTTGNGRAPSLAPPVRSAGAALPPPLAATVVGPPAAAPRAAPPLPVPVPPG